MTPGETDYGKGSFPRTWNTDTFRDNFEGIDWSRPEVPPEWPSKDLTTQQVEDSLGKRSA